MKRIGILTAGGDTPALNATLYGAVERANDHQIEAFGFIRGFAGLLDARAPHVRLNPLFQTIPELDPVLGGTMLGSSRTYIDPGDRAQTAQVKERLGRLGIEGLLCVGGDGTINGMQPLSEAIPCVLAPKTIDNDLGLNYLDEANEWLQEPGPEGRTTCRKLSGRPEIILDEIINYATPGFATSVFVVAQGVERIRTTAESHRRIAIIEVMGRESGYIALGSAYGQPDIILVPEVPVCLDRLEARIRELYSLQKHVVMVVGEGVTDEEGRQLGAVSTSVDPAGNVQFSGAAESLKRILAKRLGDDFFRTYRRYEAAESVFFTRKVGHTQRGGRPIKFDRFYAAQLGGQAVDLLEQGANNHVATLQWSQEKGFHVDSLDANKLRDQYGNIHPRSLHACLYDAHRMQPSKLGCQYLMPIFSKAIGSEDVEFIRDLLFSPGHLLNRYQSVNIDVQKRMQFLAE